MSADDRLETAVTDLHPEGPDPDSWLGGWVPSLLATNSNI
jgi:hypothetical protein